jgi:hypothetical protein
VPFAYESVRKQRIPKLLIKLWTVSSGSCRNDPIALVFAGSHAEDEWAVYLEHGKRRMLLKWQINEHTADEAYWKALAEVIKFMPRLTTKLKTFPTHILPAEHLMDQFSECTANSATLLRLPSWKRLSPYVSKLISEAVTGYTKFPSQPVVDQLSKAPGGTTTGYVQFRTLQISGSP